MVVEPTTSNHPKNAEQKIKFINTPPKPSYTTISSHLLCVLGLRYIYNIHYIHMLSCLNCVNTVKPTAALHLTPVCVLIAGT